MDCKICSEHRHLETIKVKELFIGSRDIFEYLYCRTCNSLSLADPCPDLDDLYRKYPVFDLISSKMHCVRRFLCKQVILNKNIFSFASLRLLDAWEDLSIKSLHGLSLKKHTRILDVGCGNGALIKVLKEIGFKDVSGVDPYSTQSIGDSDIRILRSPIEDLNEKFEFIMCHHSFEHMKNPYEAVKIFGRLMKPGGKLLIRIPNIESYSFRKFRESWHGIHAPFHVFLPSLSGMKKIFKDTKFEIQEIRQEQIVELFLYNINCSLDIALLEPLGVISHLGDRSLGNKIPPLFTRKEIDLWKEKVEIVKKYNMADYVAYYLKYTGV